VYYYFKSSILHSKGGLRVEHVTLAVFYKGLQCNPLLYLQNI
jgi:hypothetical protein